MSESATEGSSEGEVGGEYFGPFDSIPNDADPEDYVLCGDDKWYKKRIVAAVTHIVGTSSPHPGSIKRAERIENAIHTAVMKAISEGVQVGSPELTAVVNAARDAAMEDIS